MGSFFKFFVPVEFIEMKLFQTGINQVAEKYGRIKDSHFEKCILKI